jgi:uncharacterized protein YwqG
LELVSGIEQASFDGAEIHSQVFPKRARQPGEVDPEREIRRLTKGLDFDKLGKQEAAELMTRREELERAQRRAQVEEMAPLQIRPLAARGGRLLLELGFGKALIAFDGSGMRLLGRWDTEFPSGFVLGAATVDGFAFHRTTAQDRSGEVLIVRGEDGAEESALPLTGRQDPNWFAGASSPGATIAMASLGGKVRLVGEHAMELPKLADFDKYDSLCVALTTDARFVALAKAFDAKAIYIYDRIRKQVATVALPAAAVHPEKGAAIRIPGFELSEAELMVVSEANVQRHRLDEMEWTQPLKAPPRVKRGNTAVLTLQRALESGPLSGLRDLVSSWFRPGLVLVPKREKADRSPLGSSKSGGWPDLPVGTEWPCHSGEPMAFLLQVNLAEVAAVEPDMGLPAAGLVSVFLARDEYGYPSFFSDANSERDGCRVFYSPARSELRRTPAPASPKAADHEVNDVHCTYTFRAGGLMLPESSSDLVQRAGLSPEQGVAYRELLLAVNGSDDAPANWGTRLGGYPALVQNDDLHLQAETNARNLPLTRSSYEQWSDESFIQSARSWRQLFQLSEGKEGWIWGDAGLMHIMVSDTQWPQAEFHLAWGIGVCH